MTFLRNPHLDLTTSRIETDRCMLVPFSLDGRVDIRELQEEFCRMNQDYSVSQFLPTYEEELKFVEESVDAMKRWEIAEFFILQKDTKKLLGAIWLREPEEYRMNIWFWFRVDEQRKWYGTEVYAAFLDWARIHVRYQFLKHSLHPANTWSRKLAEKFGGILQVEKSEKGHDIYHIPPV